MSLTERTLSKRQQAGQARRIAKAAGEHRYFSPNPCGAGHVGERYTSSGMCVACSKGIVTSDEFKAYQRAYYEKNNNLKRQKRLQYHALNPEKTKADTERWNQANPERRAAISNAYKSRRRSVEKGGDSTSVIHSWRVAAPKVCHWCGAKCAKGFHVDHYVPLSKGGRHEVSNLVIACAPCNQRKSAKDPYEFAASKGRLF